MPPRIDLTGQRFGRLTVVEYAYTKKVAYWKCKCDCGNEIIVSTGGLRAKYNTSCRKCPTCIYRLSADNLYYEGFFIEKYININKAFDNFELDIFEANIDCEPINFEDMKQLIYQNGADFIIDKDMYDIISRYKWWKMGNNIIGGDERTTLQRFIMKTKNKHLTKNTDILFKNNPKYDYRINNLIFVSAKNRQNILCNKDKNKPTGVRMIGEKYQAYISISSKFKHLGYFNTLEEAAEAYNKKARELFGKFAYQNEIPKAKEKA